MVTRSRPVLVCVFQNPPLVAALALITLGLLVLSALRRRQSHADFTPTSFLVSCVDIDDNVRLEVGTHSVDVSRRGRNSRRNEYTVVVRNESVCCMQDLLLSNGSVTLPLPFWAGAYDVKVIRTFSGVPPGIEDAALRNRSVADIFKRQNQTICSWHNISTAGGTERDCWVRLRSWSRLHLALDEWAWQGQEPQTRADILKCLAGRPIHMAGDSTVRELFAELLSILLRTTNLSAIWLPMEKHASYSVPFAQYNTSAHFTWAPTYEAIQAFSVPSGRQLVMIGMGIWHIFYDDSSTFRRVIRAFARMRDRRISWIGMPHAGALPGYRIPSKVRSWNAIAESEMGSNYFDYYAITRACEADSDGIHFGFWARGRPGKCSRMALLSLLRQACSPT